MIPYIFTQLASDPFHRPNETPLNPAKWTAQGNGLGVFSNQCGAPPSAGFEFYTGVSIPADQYVAVTVGALSGGLQVVLRSNLSGLVNYSFFIDGDGGNNQNCFLAIYRNGSIPIVSTTGPVVQGDVFLCAVIGSSLFMWQNGNLVLSGTDANIAFGLPGLTITGNVTSTDTTALLFQVGRVQIPGTNTLVPLPFDARMTASAAVFASLFVAAPTGIQQFTRTASTIAALQLSYAQLVVIYQQLREDFATDTGPLNTAINAAVTTLTALNATVQAMTAPAGDAASQFAGMRAVVANSLQQLLKVQSDE